MGGDGRRAVGDIWGGVKQMMDSTREGVQRARVTFVIKESHWGQWSGGTLIAPKHLRVCFLSDSPILPRSFNPSITFLPLTSILETEMAESSSITSPERQGDFSSFLHVVDGCLIYLYELLGMLETLIKEEGQHGKF